MVAAPRRRPAAFRDQTDPPPTLGDLTFHHVVLQLADNPEQKLVTFTAEQQDETRLAQMLVEERASASVAANCGVTPGFG
jgi:hypothetical protein